MDTSAAGGEATLIPDHQSPPAASTEATLFRPMIEAERITTICAARGESLAVRFAGESE